MAKNPANVTVTPAERDAILMGWAIWRDLELGSQPLSFPPERAGQIANTLRDLYYRTGQVPRG